MQRLPKNVDGGTYKSGGLLTDDTLYLRLRSLVLGDRLLSPNFHRAVLDVIISGLMGEDPVPYYLGVIYCFAKLPKDHPILDLLVEKHCLECNEAMDTEENGEIELRSQLPVEFLIRVMLRYSNLRRKMASWPRKEDLNPCDYHGHKSEEERANCTTNEE